MPTETEVRAAFSGQGAVSEATAAEFTRQMQARGLDPSATLAKHGVAAPGQQSDNGGNPAASANPHAHVGVLSATKIAPPNLAEVERAFENWKKAGLPEEQFIAAARADGYDLVDSGEPGATQAEAQFNATFAGTTASGYDLNGVYAGRDLGELTGDLGAVASVDRDMREILSSMEFPKVLAKSFVSDVLDAASRGVPEPGPARTIYNQEQTAMACRACGVDVEAMTRTAAVALAKLPEDLRNGLHESGVLDDARVVVALFKQGERLSGRGGA